MTTAPSFPPSSPYPPFTPPTTPGWPNGEVPPLPGSFPDAGGWRSGITRRVDPLLNAPATNPGWWVWFNSLADRWTRVVCAWMKVTNGSVSKPRSPGITISDNAKWVFGYGSSLTTDHGQTFCVSFAPGAYQSMSPAVPGAWAAVSIPDLWLPPGWCIQGGCINCDPGDVCVEAHLMIQELPAYPSLPSNGDQPLPT